jgi:hypothetical protein
MVLVKLAVVLVLEVEVFVNPTILIGWAVVVLVVLCWTLDLLAIGLLKVLVVEI